MFSLALIKPIILAAASTCDASKTFFGLPVWYKYLDVSPGANGECNFHNVFYNSAGQITFDNVLLIGLAILDDLLVLAGIVAVIFVIYGGATYILSQGNPERTKAAQSTVIHALIGLVIAITAAGLVNFIGNSLGH